MDKYRLLINYLDKRIEKHNERIDQAVKSGNHDMKTICKAERAEAYVIRNELLQIIAER